MFYKCRKWVARMKRLPDAELAVMQVLWQKNGEVTAAEVQAALAAEYGWKLTSVLTFLARLAEKGFVSLRKEGKTNRYTACVSEAEYQKSESVSFVQRLFGGSVKDLVASLAEAGSMSEADVAELQAFLEEQKGGA